jgi:hypothetical protein
MEQIRLTKTELIDRSKGKVLRYPNLNTVLMVEKFLEEHQDMPMSVAKLKKGLPKQVMHQTLLLILEYLWRSGKIIYGPRGVQWTYASPEEIKSFLKEGLEI